MKLKAIALSLSLIVSPLAFAQHWQGGGHHGQGGGYHQGQGGGGGYYGGGGHHGGGGYYGGGNRGYYGGGYYGGRGYYGGGGSHFGGNGGSWGFSIDVPYITPYYPPILPAPAPPETSCFDPYSGTWYTVPYGYPC